MWIPDSGTLSRGQCSENFQYFVFEAKLYKSIAFKLLVAFVEQEGEHSVEHWDPVTKLFTLQFICLAGKKKVSRRPLA